MNRQRSFVLECVTPEVTMHGKDLVACTPRCNPDDEKIVCTPNNNCLPVCEPDDSKRKCTPNEQCLPVCRPDDCSPDER